MFRSKIWQKGAESFLLLCSLLSIIAIILITVFLFIRGLPLFKNVSILSFLFGTVWEPTAKEPKFGILAFILGSLIVTSLCMLIAVPIALATGIYIAEISNKKSAKIIRSGIEILAGIPSVVYGLFGITIVTKFVSLAFGGTGYSILSAAIILAIMTLPTIINITEVSIRAVAKEIKENSLALGATHWQSIVRVILPSARSGILAGIILGMGRAIGETMAVLMIGGNAPIMPKSLTEKFRSLTMNIITDMSYATGDHLTSLFTTGIVLFIFILLLSLLGQLTLRKLINGKGNA